jgi:flagella basal body P-ring formation protein FlgA
MRAPSILMLLAGMLAASGTCMAAEPQPLDEVRTAAVSVFATNGGTAEASVDSALRLARCSVPLQATAKGPRLALVRCDDTPGWRLYVPVRTHREVDVVVLTAPARAGAPITAEQLTVRRHDVSTADAYADPSAVVGRAPLRALPAGAVLGASDLANGTPLRRGDPVVLVSRIGEVEVRMTGRALAAAMPGATVAVENSGSRRIVRGRLVGDGMVEVLR